MVHNLVYCSLNNSQVKNEAVSAEFTSMIIAVIERICVIHLMIFFLSAIQIIFEEKSADFKGLPATDKNRQTLHEITHKVLFWRT